MSMSVSALVLERPIAAPIDIGTGVVFAQNHLGALTKAQRNTNDSRLLKNGTLTTIQLEQPLVILLCDLAILLRRLFSTQLSTIRLTVSSQSLPQSITAHRADAASNRGRQYPGFPAVGRRPHRHQSCASDRSGYASQLLPSVP